MATRSLPNHGCARGFLLAITILQLWHIYHVEVTTNMQNPAGGELLTRSSHIARPPRHQSTPTSNSTSSCQVWPKQSHTYPSGLVVTLVLTPDEPIYQRSLRQMVCNSIPSQLIHLIGPQGWDMLLIVAGDHYQSILSDEYLTACLNLTAISDKVQGWNNLDGTFLRTKCFRWEDRTKVYLAQDYHLQWPKYVQNNPSVLNLTIHPPLCDAPKSYIQGTRWYSNELLHLEILQNYQWFIKLDVDLFFHKTVPWDLLHDLQQRRALFAHSAQILERSGRTCAAGITEAVNQFRAMQGIQSMCDKDNAALKKDRDMFYTNFIIGRVDFWTQPMLRELGRFLSEYPEGFFKHRWTDQIYWGQALGLFARIEDSLADYTELRCSVERNCWQAIFFNKLYGNDSYGKCYNDGYFRHNKNPGLEWNRAVTTTELWWSENDVWPVSYKDDCDAVIRRKRRSLQSGKKR